MSLLRFSGFAIGLMLFTMNAIGDDQDRIEYLLTAVGSSNCVFVRNGDEHTAEDAEKHLRMKYERGRKWVKNVENFIERIGTQSSISGKPYSVRCGEQAVQPTAEWLRESLLGFSTPSQ